MPDKAENYVHRIGRTGRGTQKGQAISFCSKEEKPLLAEVETYITKPVEVLNIDKAEYTETITFNDPAEQDWKKLIKEDLEFPKGKKSKHKNQSSRKK
jgi:ATP-dependent RNA helicase RhlE